MPRIDDYRQALEIAKGELKGRNPDLVASFAGASVNRKENKIHLVLRFLNQEISISWEDFNITRITNKDELPLQEQILILHYLVGAFNSNGSAQTGEWISFKEIPDGRFYLDAFNRRARDPMVKSFGEAPELLATLAAERYNATRFDQGDVSVKLDPFPLISVALILWRGDDEFPPDGNILFDRNIIDILSAEDTAWLSGMIIYPLAGMAKGARI
jgi:hypothetical protein